MGSYSREASIIATTRKGKVAGWGSGGMTRLIVAALLLLLLLVPAGAAEILTNEGDPYITSTHTTGLSFYDNKTTNSTAAWASKLKAYGGVSVWIVGQNVTFNLSFLDDNRTMAGVTSANLTRLRVDVVNASTISPLLILGNETHFFGVISLSYRPVVVSAPLPPLTILIIDYLAREFKTLVWAGFVMCGALLFIYTLIIKIKKGVVSKW